MIVRTTLPKTDKGHLPKYIADMILKEKRRFIPEIAALFELARLRCFDKLTPKGKPTRPIQYLRTKNMVGRAIGVRQQFSTLLALGLIPEENTNYVKPLEMMVRLSAYAGLKLIEAMEIYKRTCLPRQYMNYRAYPAMGRHRKNLSRINDTETSPWYWPAVNHFRQEILGCDGPTWGWNQVMLESKRQCEAHGIDFAATCTELEKVDARFSAYWSDPSKAPKTDERCYLKPPVNWDFGDDDTQAQATL